MISVRAHKFVDDTVLLTPYKSPLFISRLRARDDAVSEFYGTILVGGIL